MQRTKSMAGNVWPTFHSARKLSELLKGKPAASIYSIHVDHLDFRRIVDRREHSTRHRMSGSRLIILHGVSLYAQILLLLAHESNCKLNTLSA